MIYNIIVVMMQAACENATAHWGREGGRWLQEDEAEGGGAMKCGVLIFHFVLDF